MDNRCVTANATHERYMQRRRPSWLKSRLRSTLNHIGALGMTVATGGYARWIAPYALEWTEHRMPMRNLPPSFAGYRIVQVSDLHTGFTTPLHYLRRVIEQVNDVPHDLTVVTGDLVTHKHKWVEAAADLVAKIRQPVLVIFGNHDYHTTGDAWRGDSVAQALDAALVARGIRVLRNEAVRIDRPDGRLWIVGLEDVWSGRFEADKAFAGISRDEPVLALSHNPDTLHDLAPYAPQWILAGHTHGGQIRIPVAGAMVLPVIDKRLDAGFFAEGNTRMYVTRGIGFRLPVRFRCRPEVPTFTLERAE